MSMYATSNFDKSYRTHNIFHLIAQYCSVDREDQGPAFMTMSAENPALALIELHKFNYTFLN